jgi:hydrogenase maturation protease
MTMLMAMTMTTKRRKPRLLIAGLGNLLLKDDGVGVHAVRELQKAPPPGVLVAEVGTWVLDGLHLYEWADKVLALDALQVGGAPGTIYACQEADVADPAVKASMHELSLLGALRFISPQKRPEVYVLGVEPETIDFGLDLTPKVQAALPRFLQLARETVDRWRL